VLVEQRPKPVCPFRRLAQQTRVANLLDVVGLEIDADREAVLQLEELGGVQRRPLIVLGQGLLAGAHDPDLAVALRLDVLREPVEVQDQVGPGPHVLTDLVDHEQDVLLAGLLADDVQHLLDPVVLEPDYLAGLGGEGTGVANRAG
jgi:hypothetical protein